MNKINTNKINMNKIHIDKWIKNLIYLKNLVDILIML